MTRREPPPAREPTLPEQVLYLDDELSAGTVVYLEGSEADHARRSLRLRGGDSVAVVNGRDQLAHGRIARFDKRRVEVALERVDLLAIWPRRPVRVAAGILRTARMDYLLEKVSELGARRFTPLLLDRSVARPRAEGAKGDRWHRLAVESLKQSHRARLMEVEVPTPLEVVLEQLPGTPTLWLADPGGRDPRQATLPGADGELVLFVGSEGGFSLRERGLLDSRGAVGIRLGGHRLRAETAVVVLLSTALTLLGEMGPPPEVDRGDSLAYS